MLKRSNVTTPEISTVTAPGAGMTRSRPGTGQRSSGTASEAGMTTSEFAIGSLAIALVLALVAAFGQAAMMYVGAQEAARVAARSAALGEPRERVVAAAREVMPGASVSVGRRGDLIEITVVAPDTALVSRLGLDIVARSSAVAEPGVD